MLVQTSVWLTVSQVAAADSFCVYSRKLTQAGLRNKKHREVRAQDLYRAAGPLASALTNQEGTFCTVWAGIQLFQRITSHGLAGCFTQRSAGGWIEQGTLTGWSIRLLVSGLLSLLLRYVGISSFQCGYCFVWSGFGALHLLLNNQKSSEALKTAYCLWQVYIYNYGMKQPHILP